LANLNRIILVGRLTADAEGKTVAGGEAMARFRLIVDRPFGQGAEAHDQIDIVAWRGVAEPVVEQGKKGALALVEGRIQNRSFDDQSGQRRWVTEVVARSVSFLDRSAKAGLPGKPEPVGAAEPNDGAFFNAEELADDLPF
jgi:single-strand DNA-binding protein